MVKNNNNKFLESLNTLSKTIDQANKEKVTLEQLELKRHKLRSIDFDPLHKFFPYGNYHEILTNKAMKKTFLLRICHALTLLTISIALLLVPSAVIGVLSYYEIVEVMPLNENLLLVGLTSFLTLIIFVGLLRKIKSLSRGLTQKFLTIRKSVLFKRKDRLLVKKYAETEDIIVNYKNNVKVQLKDLDAKIKQQTLHVDGLHDHIEATTLIPKRFIKDIEKLKEYAEDMRASDVQEAVNILVKERREEKYFNQVIEQLKKNTRAIEALNVKFDAINSDSKLNEDEHDKPEFVKASESLLQSLEDDRTQSEKSPEIPPQDDAEIPKN